jgi:tetratricopeptide (TPR) repeat protein
MAMSRSEYPRAIELYSQDLAANPQDAFTFRKLGQAQVYNGDYAQAETRFREYLASHPGDWFSTFYLGLALIGKGERDAGLAVLGNYQNLGNQEENRLVREAVDRYRDQTGLEPTALMSKLEQSLAAAQQAQVQYDRDNDGIGTRSDTKYLTPM